MATIEGIIAQLENYRTDLAGKLDQVDRMLAAAKNQAGKKAADTVCELCGKKFQTGGALGSHKVIKHGLPGESTKAVARRKRIAKTKSADEFLHYEKPENREPGPGSPRTRPGLGASVRRRGDAPRVPDE